MPPPNVQIEWRAGDGVGFAGGKVTYAPKPPDLPTILVPGAHILPGTEHTLNFGAPSLWQRLRWRLAGRRWR